MNESLKKLAKSQLFTLSGDTVVVARGQDNTDLKHLSGAAKLIDLAPDIVPP